MLHVLNATFFRPVWAAIALLRQIRDAHPEHFEWDRYPTLVNPSGALHLDKLLGVQEAERLFDQPRDSFAHSVQALLDVSKWRETITPHLLYGD